MDDAHEHERPSQEWFNQPPRVSVAPSVRPSGLPPARPAGAPLASTAAGLLAGLLGAGLALAAYTGISPARLSNDLVGCAVLAGAILGGFFGGVSRRLFRPVLRMLWAVAVAVSLWLVVYAFVLTRVVPGIGLSAPFLRTALVVALYGLCVGIVPPLGRRSERGRSA